MIFLNSLEQRVAPLLVLTHEKTDEINQPSKLLITATHGLEKNDRIIFSGKEFLAVGVEETRGRDKTVEIYAEESIVELKGKLIADKRPSTLLAALQAITEETRWAIGTYPNVTGISLSFFRISSFEALGKVLEAYGLELETSYNFGGREITRTLNLKSRIGQARGRRTTLNTDATEIKRTYQDTPVVTRLYPYGKGEELESGAYGRRINISTVNGGLDYIEDNPARIAYGIGKDRLHFDAVLIYEDVEDPAVLLQKAQADFELLKTPKVTYEGKIADLGLYDDNLGDDITILDGDIAVKGRILKLVTTPKEKRATVGNLLPSLGSEYARVRALERKIRDYDIFRNALVGLENKDYLDGIIDRINAELNTVSGFASLVPGRGIIIPNAPDEADATQIIELGGGYWRIADSKDGSGNWNYRTIADGRGIIATEIIAGILKGGNVQFNLEAGTFLIGNPADPNFYWDGANLIIKGDAIDLSTNTHFQSKVSSSEMADYVTGATSNLASKSYVDDAVEAINRANPNLVSNRSDRWEQGNIVSGALTTSLKHIRTSAYHPVRSGPVTIKVSPLYEVALAFFDTSYGYISTTPFLSEQTITIPDNRYFKAILKRVGTDDIIPGAIDTAELKVENAGSATQWTPYFGDLTLEEQKEFFQLDLTSSDGWTVDTNVFGTTLQVALLLFNEDVTNRYPGANITWYRQYPGEAKSVIGSGTTYTVTPSQTEKSATYEVVFSIPINIFYLRTKSGMRLLTKNNNLLIAQVVDNDSVAVSESKVLVRDYRDRIDSAESSIIQMANDITLRVTETRFNSEVGALQTSVATLSVKANSIEAAINGATHTFTANSYVFKDANGNVIMDNALGMANEQNNSVLDNVESGFPLRLKIHFGSSVSQVHQVLLKYVNRAYRTFSKSASAGGGSVVTSAAGGGVSTTTASGGGHSSGAGGSVGAVYTGPAWEWSNASGHYHQVPSTPNHSHWVYDHAHYLTLAAHQHSLSLPTHTHNIIHEIVELALVSNAIEIAVNGTVRATVNAANGEVDLTPWITTNGWHDIELRSTTRKRIEAHLFAKTYIRR